MEDRQFHINCAAGEIGKYVLLTGDPDRVPEIAAHLEHSRKVAQKREFTTYTGALEGVPVSVISTGIGGSSAVIAMEECVALGAHTMIRIGTCGGMQPELIPGTLILPTGAIRMEGTTREYLPLEFPAVPDFDLLCSLTAAAAERGCRYRTGVVQCKDSFYGQHSPQTMPVRQKLLNNWQAWKEGGALASEMESAALFITAAVRHVRCATVLQMIWNQEREQVVRDSAHAADDMTNAIAVAVDAMRRQILREKKSGEKENESWR